MRDSRVAVETGKLGGLLCLAVNGSHLLSLSPWTPGSSHNGPFLVPQTHPAHFLLRVFASTVLFAVTFSSPSC